jgi:Fic family protein
MPTKQKINNIKSTLTSLINTTRSTLTNEPAPSHTKTTLYADSKNTQDTNSSYYNIETATTNTQTETPLQNAYSDANTQEMDITNEDDIIDKYANQLDLLTPEYINELPQNDKESIKQLLAEES